MLERSAAQCASFKQKRVAFVHSAGNRMFLGRSRDEGGREVTVEEVEALAAAGFDIVEVNMHEGKPLCAELGSAREQWPHAYPQRHDARLDLI